MSQNGRPPKFNPERCQAIITDISKGIPYILAAEANGICEATLYAWLQEGRRDLAKGIDSDKAKFSESIKKVERDTIDFHLQVIKAMPKNWAAHAWILERRWYKYFSSSVAVYEFNKQLERLEASGQGESDET